ncbi:hypothetical protein NDU88_005464 [Pleurodeles waltl]|uniref:Uncharacterized protein n=1 Tax=Pleurodeles waltl TaxID=8319 RepID=A0AAV7MXZ2_PLEWA|nr:hypothetical protein NDU88_005464 [Pleurodeles waltl]
MYDTSGRQTTKAARKNSLSLLPQWDQILRRKNSHADLGKEMLDGACKTVSHTRAQEDEAHPKLPRYANRVIVNSDKGLRFRMRDKSQETGFGFSVQFSTAVLHHRKMPNIPRVPEKQERNAGL